MAIRNIHASKGFIFTGLLILSLMFQFLPQHFTNHLNLIFVRYFNPFLRLGRSASVETSRMSETKDGAVPKSRYDQLWKSHKNLLARLDVLNKDYQTLSKIRQALPMPASAIVLAKTTAASRPARHELIIDRGSNDGIDKGQFVLSPQADSVIGSIREVSDRMSRVQLITDLTCNLQVRIRREGTRLDLPAHLFGDGKTGCRINLIPRDTEIRPGDTVYAAAVPGRLEIPVVIGEVGQVIPDLQNPLLCQITVRIVENLDQLKDAAVIIPPLPKRNQNTEKVKNTRTQNKESAGKVPALLRTQNSKLRTSLYGIRLCVGSFSVCCCLSR